MLISRIKAALVRFRDDCGGTISVEAVITVPILYLALAFSYEYFEVHRFKSVREKATYTIADIISREISDDGVTSIYLDNALQLFHLIANDTGKEQIRVSVVKYDAETDKYSISWSQVRGDGGWIALVDSDVADSHATLPVMDDGEEVILVESRSIYHRIFNIGLASNRPIDTRVFTSIRFAPQVCYEGNCG